MPDEAPSAPAAPAAEPPATNTPPAASPPPALTPGEEILAWAKTVEDRLAALETNAKNVPGDLEKLADWVRHRI